MSRKKRIWYPGASYHVMSRGNRRLILYKDSADFLDFLEGVDRAKKIYPFRLHAVCLMTNHFHILIETGEDELWKIMKKILHSYAMVFNQRYHYTGHLFESRYTSCLIEDERYFLEVSRYIHLNPVKARMVREPLAYDYSSYSSFVNVPGGDHAETGRKDYTKEKIAGLISELVDTDRVLGAFRNNSREQYRMFVEGKISHAEQEMLIQKDMNEDDLWLPW